MTNKTLFSEINDSAIPLAERVRPRAINEIIGQEHLTGESGQLRKLIESGTLPSMILWGPPGVGKTTLARILALEFGLPCFSISAVTSGVKEIRSIIDKASRSGSAVVFIDEIHRFSKSQQDSLLGAVEAGTIRLIGATTENPSFEVISPLLSRCQVYVLEPLSAESLIKVARHAIETDKMFASRSVELKETDVLLRASGGDARKLLNLLDILVSSAQDEKVVIEDKMVNDVLGKRVSYYDKAGEQHYDIISAFIKSIRGSDTDAALYWLARMIEGGEDPKFIARRMLILASEDIGNANPTALVMAANCFQAVTMVGYPECEIILSQVVIYLANSPKSNSAYLAIRAARALVRDTGDLAVPLHLRNAPTKLMKDLDYGSDYAYPHDHPGGFVRQNYLPEEIMSKTLYTPGDNEREKEYLKKIKALWGRHIG